ncbi:MAG: hypothetical protein WC340_02910 [Kiritimatiellia bacterium]
MNPKLIKWEEPLFKILRADDNQLETEFGDLWKIVGNLSLS